MEYKPTVKHSDLDGDVVLILLELYMSLYVAVLMPLLGGSPSDQRTEPRWPMCQR